MRLSAHYAWANFYSFNFFPFLQSQGSLSELLSKPRHWEKLTDKGKEAFRRMYGWMSNPRAIELLCAVSPRRNQPLGSNLLFFLLMALFTTRGNRIFNVMENCWFYNTEGGGDEVRCGSRLKL